MSLSNERSGEIVELLSPNGCGKSTVLNMLSGVFPPNSGEVWLGDQRILRLPAHVIAAKGVARTFQLVRLIPSLSVRDNIKLAIAFGPNAKWGAEADRRADEKLEIVGLAGAGNVPVSQFNYIDQKRVEMARAIAADPHLLLLDEWLAGVNPIELLTGIALLKEIHQSKVTIVLVEHIMEAVRALCPRCIVMSSGAMIADGDTQSVLSARNVVDTYLGSDDA